MAKIDLVFEGGGAKGMVFVGALQALMDEAGHEPGRVLGTSAGAITATLLAAGYTVPEMLDSLTEKENGRSVFAGFLGAPHEFDQEAIRNSAIRTFLRNVDVPFLPNILEERLDDWLAQALARHPRFRHLFSFVERGGWYAADAFLVWMARKLDEGAFQGQPRRFSRMTLAEFHAATGCELTLVASDTTAQRMLILNHHTAPDCPVAWATRMSMSIPLLWQEVVWQPEWGRYRNGQMAGHVIVDGGMLSNFPISLFLSSERPVTEIMGEPATKNVLGLLIDESQPVPAVAEALAESSALNFAELRTAQRLGQLINTMTSAHDNMAIQVFREHVVRLPAQGYGTIEFDMADARREALIAAGHSAMQAFLLERAPVFEAGGAEIDLAPSERALDTAKQVAADILAR